MNKNDIRVGECYRISIMNHVTEFKDEISLLAIGQVVKFVEDDEYNYEIKIIKTFVNNNNWAVQNIIRCDETELSYIIEPNDILKELL